MEVFGEEGILIDILSRLPVKSLLRFRSVCRQWRSVISDPDFAKLQLQRSKEEDPTSCSRLLSFGNRVIWSIDCQNLSGSGKDGAVRPLKPPSQISNPHTEIVGSCDGLVCLVVLSKYFILWNPTTGACNELPFPGPPDSYWQLFYGFGYDPSTGDYKVLRGACSNYRGDASDGTVIDIYSCKTNSWRKKYCNSPMVTGRGIYLNGSLYWLRKRHRPPFDVISFDLAHEEFEEEISPLPLSRSSFTAFIRGLMVREDCLFLYQGNEAGTSGMITFEGWTLDCRLKSPWTKSRRFFIEKSPLLHSACPIWFRKDGKVVFHSWNWELTMPDPDSEEGYCWEIGKEFMYEHYVESLVSPFPNYI